MASAQQWLERVDHLTLKERVLLLSTVLLVLVKLWDGLLIQPLERQRQQLQGEVSSIGQTLRETQALVDAVVASGQIDPDANLQGALARSRTELATVNDDIKDKVGRMVPRERMAEVLSSVLRHFDQLEFVALEGLGAEAIVTPAAAVPATAGVTAAVGVPAAATAIAYRHGIRIRFKGSYFAALAYLQALEGLPWGFFWDRIELETQDYPRAEGAIVVYTLSLDRNWIGV